jgi:predicted transcriptional regulator of viral defense system
MNNEITFKGLGSKEVELLARLSYEKKRIFSSEEIDNYLPSDFKYRNQMVYALKQKNILIPIKRGFYIFSPLEEINSLGRINELLIPSVFFPKKNYYIGYSTMFNYYGFTEQLFQTVYVLNTTLSKAKVINTISYQFIKVSDNRMYGVDEIQILGQEVVISSKEKTLVDLVYFNKAVGGLKAAEVILRDTIKQNKCDLERLILYATMFPVANVRKFIGYTLDSQRVNNKLLLNLAKSIENSSITSLTRSRKGTLNKNWRVIVNDS